MNYPKYSDPKELARKLYPNPSASHLTNRDNPFRADPSRGYPNGAADPKKIVRYRRYEQSEEDGSERLASRSDVFNTKSPGVQQINGIGE